MKNLITLIPVILLFPYMLSGQNGNVGIGQKNPEEKLHIAGKLRVDSLAGSGDRIVYVDMNGTLHAADSNNSLILKDSLGNVRVIIDPNRGAFEMLFNDTVWYSMIVADTDNANLFPQPKYTVPEKSIYSEPNIPVLKRPVNTFLNQEGNTVVTDGASSIVYNQQAQVVSTEKTDFLGDKVKTEYRYDGSIITTTQREFNNGASETREYDSSTNITTKIEKDGDGNVTTTSYKGDSPLAFFPISVEKEFKNGDEKNTIYWPDGIAKREEESYNHSSGETTIKYYDMIGLHTSTVVINNEIVARFDASGNRVSKQTQEEYQFGPGASNPTNSSTTVTSGGVNVGNNASNTNISGGWLSLWGNDGSMGSYTSRDLYINGGEGQQTVELNGSWIKWWSPDGSTQNGFTVNPGVGTVHNGNFSVHNGTKAFKIDHPLDPDNKYLYHFSIESDEVLNQYSGNARTDENGFATVTLPDYFEEINKDFRYQLTVIGSFTRAMISKKISDNQFEIRTEEPDTEVSWEITATRNDRYIRENPVQSEKNK